MGQNTKSVADSLAYFGDAVKALDDSGKVGGYLIRFTDAAAKDLSGEYFTSETYLGAKEGDGADVVFHHGQPLPFKSGVPASVVAELNALQDHMFNPVKTKRDAIGIWAETVLDLRDEYEAAVYGMVKTGKLGWSSGAVGHLVKKAEDGHITRWPIGEASLTPQPCEPCNRVVPVKSLDSVPSKALDEPATEARALDTLAAKLTQHVDDLADGGLTRDDIIAKMAQEAGLEVEQVANMLKAEGDAPTAANLKAFARVLSVSYNTLRSYQQRDYAKTIKGMFAEMLAEPHSRLDIDSAYCKVIATLAAHALTGRAIEGTFDLEAKVKEATQEYAARLEAHTLTQVKFYVDAAADDAEPFSLQAVISVEDSVKQLSAIDLDAHSQLAVTAGRELTKRLQVNHQNRLKSGRVLSEKNRQRIAAFNASIEEMRTALQELLAESEPKASDAEKRAEHTAFLRLQQRIQKLGVN